MKNYIPIILIIFLAFPFLGISQTDTIWYDSNWKATDKKDASFFRPPSVKKGDGYWVVDHYISGSKQMEGLTLDLESEAYHGKVTWFYENGKTFQIVNYDKGILSGLRQVYHENGKLKSETEYVKGKIHGKWLEYYDSGTQKELGNYVHGEKDGSWKVYYPNGKLKEEGNYVSDRKVEVWKTHFYDGSEQKD